MKKKLILSFLYVAFAWGDWNYFPFNFLIQHASNLELKVILAFYHWYGYQVTLFGDYTASEV